MNEKEQIQVAVDFDGVIHSFSSGWKGHGRIDDGPTPGAIAWLRMMIANPYVEISIFSARSWKLFGNYRMKKWLLNYGLTKKEVKSLKFWLRKPVCDVLIDDRCFCFQGVFPTVREMMDFVPWHGHSVWGEMK